MEASAFANISEETVQGLVYSLFPLVKHF
jgi:hypothetical protein